MHDSLHTKSVLLITDVNFWELNSGGRARLFSLVKYLSKNVALTVVNTGPAPQGIELYLKGIFNANFEVLEKKKYLKLNGYGRRLKKLLKNKHFDIVIIEYIYNSYFLNFLSGAPKVILDTVDIMSQRTDAFKKYNHTGEVFELTRETEIEIFNLYDYIVVICEPDYEDASTMIGKNKVLLCPHPVSACLQPLRNEVKNIVFIAGTFLPNRDAINWFIANCWPQIIAKYDVRLNIYGNVCRFVDLNGNSHVHCEGFVNDINQIYENADIIINPVRFGGGLKIKNIEALGNGMPLITTPHGSRGLEAGAGEAFLVAETPDDFVKAVFSLIENRDLRQKLKVNAHTFVKQHFSAENCFKPIIEINDFRNSTDMKKQAHLKRYILAAAVKSPSISIPQRIVRKFLKIIHTKKV